MKKPANRDEKGRFPKGVSGNPKGRPSAGLSMRELLRARLDEIPDKKQRLIDLYIAAIEANPLRMHEFMDQTDGKLPNRTEVTGGTDDDGNEKPIPIKLLRP